MTNTFLPCYTEPTHSFIRLTVKHVPKKMEPERKMDMVMAIYWLIAAIVLAVVEVATTSLVSIWFVFGALVSMIFAYFGLPFYAQIIAFILVSGIIMLFVRPFAKKIAYQKTTPTNADRIVGSEGVIVEGIDDLSNLGQVKVMGQIWSAKTEDGSKLAKDTIVKIIKIEGVKAIVAKVEEGEKQ